MRFWDTSAIVPLLIKQEASQRMRDWLAADGVIVAWTLTPVEVASALQRLVRERSIAEESARVAEGRSDDLFRTSHVVTDIDQVKSSARRLLRVHPLRAFDALQLGAALLWAGGDPQGRTLHTLDARLVLAAQREGFSVPT